MRRSLGAAVLLLALTACSDPESTPAAQPPGPDPDPSAPASSPVLTGGTSDAPTVVTPGTELLAWAPVTAPSDVSVTTVTADTGTWTLAYDEEAGRATLTGPAGVVADTTRGKVSDALLSDTRAVVVHQDPAEDDPATAVVTDLADASTRTLDASTPGAPTVSGGTWALAGDRAAYATRGPDDAYCLAEADLSAETSRVVWCAGPRQGFNAAHLSDAGDAILTFDDAQPSCRTVVAVADDAVTPLEGVAACEGFEGVLTAEGAVWSVVPDAERIEAAHYHARVGDGFFDLGPGTSGTLVACGDAAYFVRDPQSDTDPARLLRWRAGDLDVVYESAPGRAFLAEPRCGGDTVLSVSSYAEGGDEQVSVVVAAPAS